MIYRMFKLEHNTQRLGRVSLDKYVVTGGKPLKGTVTISGAKNAAIAIIPAAILSDEVCRIENVPNITDVNDMLHVLFMIWVQSLKESINLQLK